VGRRAPTNWPITSCVIRIERRVPCAVTRPHVSARCQRTSSTRSSARGRCAIAAWIASRSFGYTRDERLTVWSLTLPQVAATLAATLVAYQTRDAGGRRLLDNHMLNAVLVLMLTTSILGPVMTERFAPRLARSGEKPRRSIRPTAAG